MTLYLVRHASAGERARWKGDDRSRPLDERGRDQAAWLADLLGPHPIARVLSSPYERCRQTVEPLATRLGLPVVDDQALAEGASVPAARALVGVLASAGADAVLCSHGDVIPDLLDVLSDEDVPLVGKRAVAKGSVWRLDARDGRIVRGVYVPPGW